MANQVIVTNTGNVQVALTPPANVQVQISRAAIGTVSNVPTANFANYAGNVTGANQPNITGLGTLSNLSVSGNTTLNNLVVTGNLSVGNLIANNANYANFAGVANTANSVALANVAGAGNIASINLDGNVANLLTGNGTFVAIPTVSANANYANFAGEAFNVNASNITGTVANANYAANAGNATIANSANSVTLANVSGAGNIASINLDGNASNILFGNGAFSAIPVVSNVANANYANFSGTAFSVSGSNVSGEVANAAYANAANTANLATYATTANSVAGANVSGTVANATFALDAGNSNLANVANSVAVANVSGIGNIATLNLDGNASNILFGNGTFSAIPVVSNVANANYANFAGTAFNVSGSNVSGEVANAAYANAANTANLATYATTANSVAGANVSGTVANATFALDAGNSNLANTANSVALANVVGIGNIANINLDGSSSNVLFGNGVFAPESTSIANANYANFAGTLINGNSNITIAANSSILISAAGNANVMTVDGNGTIFTNPLAGGYNNWLRINNYGTTANGQNASRIASFRYRGSSGANLSVQPNDALMDFLALGYNGTSLATNSSGRIKAVVDNSYTANGANIPVGWQVQVNDTNGGINNQAKIHNFYANGNVTFANSVFVTDSLSVTGNVNGGNILSTGNIQGDKLLSNSYILANSYVQANTFNANYSVSVGNGAVSNAQIFLNGDKTTGSGILLSDGQFSVAMSNVDPTTGFSPFFFSTYSSAYASVSPIRYFRARGIDFANRTSVTTGDYITDQVSSVYADSGNTYFDVASQNIIVTNNNGAGNVTANLNFSMNNIGSNINFSAGNTYANILTANYFKGDGSNLTNINGSNVSNVANANYANFAGNLINGTSNISIPSANGTIAFSVNNVANLVMLENGGFMNTFPTSSAINMLRINTFNSALSDAHRIAWFRARGSNTSPTSVQANDRLGVLGFFGHNGANYQTNSVSLIRATVDSSYTANGANIPIGLQLIVNDTNGGVNNQTKTHNFYANGATVLNGNLNAIGGNFTVDKTTAGALTMRFAGDKTPNSSFDLYDAQFSVTMSNVDTTTGFSPFRFQQYAPTSNEFGPMYFYRSRGTAFANSLPVVANDKIMSLNFLVNSNNTTTSVAAFDSTVTYNDDAGNVGSKLDFNAIGSGTTGYLNGVINLLANTTNANNLQANNVTVSNSVNGFMRVSQYTAAGLTAITGVVGQIAAVTNSAGGGNPNGMIAFWDTTHSRWSYIHDNSAV